MMFFSSYFASSHFLQEYNAHNDDTTVNFEILMTADQMNKAKQEGLLKKFKLTTTLSTSNMHLFDANGVIKKYDTPEQSKYSYLSTKITDR